jgi:transcriptional regulator with XRE-family HTH domain
MAPTTISKIENGRYNVSVDILGKVADALGYKLTFEERR